VSHPPLLRLPDASSLRQMFHRRYGPQHALGWGPRLRQSCNYYTPDDIYESLVAGLIVKGMSWLDVGCGRELFPNNLGLAEILSKRCEKLTGVDPDPTLEENPWVHEKIQGGIDTFDGEGGFDLVTMRMVAEHIADPSACVKSIARALRPGGLAVVYTVSAISPMPLLTCLAPMGLRHVVKSWLWGTQPKDTFPTCFKMNSRSVLMRQFLAVGMKEETFMRLDDCRTFAKFQMMSKIEMKLMRACRAIGMPYPEHCLLGIYRKQMPK
jgi:2-polyprenyl-3-methyl-5-hydroxy-6-metoxy-1,4-benzoquinol methylase